MPMTRWLAGIGLSLNLLSGCATPQAPCHRSTIAAPCPAAVRCPSPVAARPVVARTPAPDPWLALKDLEPLPGGLEPPAVRAPAPVKTQMPPGVRTRALDFADEALTGARPGTEPAPAPGPPDPKARLRLELENDLVLGRHDLALDRLVTYVRDVAGGKQPRPSDALLAGLRQDLLALARETQALALKTKSRRFRILGLAAYQLLSRLPQPAAAPVAADDWRPDQELALYDLLAEEAKRLPQPPPAPPPPRKPEDRDTLIRIVPVGRPVVHGQLDAAVIRLVVRRRLPEVRACYEQALGRALVAGVFQLRLFVDGWGRVTLASVVKNATGDAVLAQCVEERMRNWIFPEVTPQDSLTQITYPLILSAEE